MIFGENSSHIIPFDLFMQPSVNFTVVSLVSSEILHERFEVRCSIFILDNNNNVFKKKRLNNFSEKRLAYFPLIDTDLTEKSPLANSFFPQKLVYLAIIWHRYETQTLTLIRHGAHTKWRIQQFFCCCAYLFLQARICRAVAWQRYV